MLSSDELRAVVQRAQQCDPTAIGELYTGFAGQILRYIYVRVAEPELAQDLTQEVFIKIINGIGRFEYRDEKSFLGWIYTIAANVVASHQRRCRFISTSFDVRDDLMDAFSHNDIHAITDRIALRQAFEKLTPDQQQVLTLRFFADMSNSEIASVLQRTEGAIKAIQHRALRSLYKILSQENEGLARSYSSPPLEIEQGRLCRRSQEEHGDMSASLNELPPTPCDAPAGD